MTEFGYGFTNDLWNAETGFPTRGQAFKAGLADKTDEDSDNARLTLYTFEVLRPTIGHFLGKYGEVLWEHLIEFSWDEAGEDLSQAWGDMLDTGRAHALRNPAGHREDEIAMEALNFELRKAVEAWATAFGLQPNFWLAREVQAHPLAGKEKEHA